MKKSLLGIVLATSLGSANAEPLTSGTFTMLSPGGGIGTFGVQNHNKVNNGKSKTLTFLI